MFPFKSEAIADKRTTNPLRSEEKKERTYFKSDWTCFKANNSVSPKGHRSSQTHVSIKFVLVGSVVMVGKVELDSTFPIIIIQTVWRRPIADHMETRLSNCDPVPRRACMQATFPFALKRMKQTDSSLRSILKMKIKKRFRTPAI